jgi:hypothetical protein
MELPTPKLALIREKRAQLFPDNPQACPVLLSGPEPELKMAANSTYWEAKPEGWRGGNTVKRKGWAVLEAIIWNFLTAYRRKYPISSEPLLHTLYPRSFRSIKRLSDPK